MNGALRMRLPCESCGELHIDEGEFALKPHHTHQCAKCGLVWRPCEENTVGVRYLWDQAEFETVENERLRNDIKRIQTELMERRQHQYAALRDRHKAQADLIEALEELDALKKDNARLVALAENKTAVKEIIS